MTHITDHIRARKSVCSYDGRPLAEADRTAMLGVSRQSVSRWEMDITFPETEKIIRLSRILDCSIDYLLNDRLQGIMQAELSQAARKTMLTQYPMMVQEYAGEAQLHLAFFRLQMTEAHIY